MATYAFLSPEWIEAARALREEFAADAEIPASTMRMNLTVEEVPYGDGVVEAHVDTTAGLVDIELGHLDSLFLPAGCVRAVDNRTAEPASMFVIRPGQ